MVLLKTLQELQRNNPDYPWLTLHHDSVEHQFTIDELCSRINDFVAVFSSKDFSQRDTVIIILKESLDLYASFLAATIYGLLPAYHHYPSPKHSTQNFLNSLSNLTAYNDIKAVITFTETEQLISSQGFDVINPEKIEQSSDSDLSMVKGSKNEAFLQFSSGTTGAKKGVLITSRALFNQITAYEHVIGLDQNSSVASWLPHYHDMGLIACMLLPLLKKVHVHMMSPFEWVSNPASILKIITDNNCTHIWLPNFALGHLTRNISDSALSRYDLSKLTHIVCCSEPLLEETYNSFLAKFSVSGLSSRVFQNCYAMAENTFAISSTKVGKIKFKRFSVNKLQAENIAVEDNSGKAVASAGIPLANIEIKISGKTGSFCADGNVGEICIASDCMLDEYYNNKEKTEECMLNGFFKTGDLGFFYENELYVLGRKNDTIIVAGENIYPFDIEECLNQIPGLIPGRNVAFGVQDKNTDTDKIIILAETDEQQVDKKLISSLIFNRFSITAHDIYLFPRNTLIKSTAGKISRTLNKQAFLDDTFNLAAEEITNNDALFNILEKFVSGPSNLVLEKNTHLFESGLINSLGFASLITEIERAENISVPHAMLRQECFSSYRRIKETINSLKNNEIDNVVTDFEMDRESGLLEKLRQENNVKSHIPIWEKVINNFPFKGTFFYRILFRLAGINIGRNVVFLGKPTVKLRGRTKNITIGNNVILGHHVDLRIRENGRIYLQDNSYCDSNVRLVAAREGKIIIGEGTEIGANTVINSGGNVITGKYCMIAGNVNLNSSSHGIAKDSYIKIQPHTHGQITLGDDVWVGSGASILMNSFLGTGAVISSNSLVSGAIPEFAVCSGVPAKVIKFRE